MNKLHDFMEDTSVVMDNCLCGKPRVHEMHPHTFKRIHNYLVVNVCECSMPLHAVVHDTPKTGG